MDIREDIQNCDKKFKTILADPPWRFQNSTGKMAPEHKRLSRYPTMNLEDIKSLPVSNLCNNPAHLYLWVPNALLTEGLEVMKSWGFKYKTIAFNWIKTTSKGNYCKNVAPWTMKSSEICLFGVKGMMTKYKKANNIESLVVAERTKHSKKPEEVRNRIELLFGDLPRIELFARKTSPGWDVWGNEV